MIFWQPSEFPRLHFLGPFQFFSSLKNGIHAKLLFWLAADFFGREIKLRLPVPLPDWFLVQWNRFGCWLSFILTGYYHINVSKDKPSLQPFQPNTKEIAVLLRSDITSICSQLFSSRFSILLLVWFELAISTLHYFQSKSWYESISKSGFIPKENKRLERIKWPTKRLSRSCFLTLCVD